MGAGTTSKQEHTPKDRFLVTCIPQRIICLSQDYILYHNIYYYIYYYIEVYKISQEWAALRNIGFGDPLRDTIGLIKSNLPL